MTSNPLAAPDLESLASAAYGRNWQSRLAREMGIAVRTVQRWARDGVSKAATADSVRLFLEERNRTRLRSPAPGTSPEDDRMADCRAAVEPSVAAIVAAATVAGWHPVETLRAIKAMADDMLRAGQEP